MAIDSVPPSCGCQQIVVAQDIETLTGEGSGHKDRCKPTYASNKRCVTDVPIAASNVFSHRVGTTVDRNPKDDEDLSVNLGVSRFDMFALIDSR